ncbi:MAG: hypothetical protein M1573_01425 [Candidatus Parvarchaeota archaeon]|nr:hypothetical protein [Candidatus Parvarchaeota archaeon]MCL5017883.1 hypothetical protein [Candidatus Parvarchaeota archaeon]
MLCSVCGRDFVDELSLSKHRRTAIKQCEICGFETESDAILKKHIKGKHYSLKNPA